MLIIILCLCLIKSPTLAIFADINDQMSFFSSLYVTAIGHAFASTRPELAIVPSQLSEVTSHQFLLE